MRVLVLAVLLSASFPAIAEGGPVITAEYTNPGLIPAHWTLEIHPDGHAHFRSERGNAPRDNLQFEAPNLNQDVQVSPKFAEHVFEVAKRKKRFETQCESHLKVAYQGTKRLAYAGPDGEGACEYNYSKDADIQSLGEALQSVANTLIVGARLQTLLQHDRLGLDKETEILTESAADGRAQQIGSIRDILERLADDDSVLERVRRRAKALLARSEN